MQNTPAWGTSTRVVATGPTVITSANAQIIGVLFCGTGTGSVSIFAGVTATSTGGGALLATVVGYATVPVVAPNPANYVPFPANCSGGITLNLGATTDPCVTLFWNPTGGA